MGLRFRKSIKILPGVRVNFNKSSTSVTFGSKGLKHTISSTGRRTTTVGLPGTGLSYSVQSKKSGVSAKQAHPSSPSTRRRRNLWIPIVLWLWGAYYLGYDLLALYCLLTGVTTFQDFWVLEVFQKFFAGAALVAVGTCVFCYLSRKTKTPSAEPTQEPSNAPAPVNVNTAQPTIKADRISTVAAPAEVQNSVVPVPDTLARPAAPSPFRAVPSAEPVQEPSAKKTPDAFPRITVPKRVGSQILLYHYHNIRFSPADDAQAIAEQIVDENTFELSVAMDGGQAVVSGRAGRLGILIDRVDMVRDWLSKGDLVRVWLENYGDSGCYLFLAFYRDEERRLSWREFTVVRLTQYANLDAQLSIMDIAQGDKLDFDEDTDRQGNDIVRITYGTPIGALPKKYAQRYFDEGAAAVFVDHVDYDNEKDRSIPYVKIYW